MKILVMKDKEGGTAYLTDESTSSSYGIPILQITAHDIDSDFGPADLIGDLTKPETILTAAQIVYAWAILKVRTKEERQAAKSFLSQWPDGPQIED